jgi:protein required for attachment to host cells
MKQDTYILIADAARARLFAARRLAAPWRAIRVFAHPRSAAKGSDIMADRPGRVHQSADRRRSAMEPRTPPRRVEAEHFARELADALETAHGQYRQLVLVASPRFLGFLRSCLSDAVRATLTISLGRDWTEVPARELPARLAAARA